MNVAENRVFINASKELMNEIAEYYDVKFRTVQMALAFQSNSPSARLCRKYALEHGGEMYQLQKVKDVRKHLVKFKTNKL